MSLATAFVGWLTSLFPEWTPPTWLTDEGGALATAIQAYSGLGVWVDWASVGVCLTVVLTTWALTGGVRLIRAVIAHIPLFGGSGA